MNYFNHFSEPDNVNLIQIHLKKNVKENGSNIFLVHFLANECIKGSGVC